MAKPESPKILLDVIADHAMFDGLPSAELSQVTGYVSFQSLKEDDVLFEEGDDGDFMCFVASGEMEMVKGEGTSALVLATIGAGRSFGEMVLVDQMCRSATARAKLDSDLVVLTRDAFEDLIKASPRIGVKLLKQLARLMSLNLRRTSAKLTYE